MTQSQTAISALQQDIFHSKVLRARAQSIDEKLFEGPRLHDLVCQRMRDGIRSESPEFSEEDVERELRRRLAIRRRLDERGLYRDAGVIGDE